MVDDDESETQTAGSAITAVDDDPEAAADLESGGWWPTPQGIKERAAEIRAGWSQVERAAHYHGTDLPDRAAFEAATTKREATPETVFGEIEDALLTAGRLIRQLRPALGEGQEAFGQFIDRLEDKMSVRASALLEIARFADRRDSVERFFRAAARLSTVGPRRMSFDDRSKIESE